MNGCDLITHALLSPSRVTGLSALEWDMLVRQGRRANLLARLAHRIDALELGIARLREGFPLSLRLIREIHAVLLRDGYSYVFRLGPDNRVIQTKVGVGQRSGDRVALTNGLEPGMAVVSTGVGFLADGDLVRIVESR